MGRSEARVFTSIWSDPDFVALPLSAQRMYLFLLSQPDLSFCGRLPLRTKWWARSAPGLTPKAVCDDLDTLEAARFVLIDKDSQELLIRSLMRRDHVLKSPKLMKPLGAALQEVGSPALRKVLAEELTRAVDEGIADGVSANAATSLTPVLQLMIKYLETPGGYPIAWGIAYPSAYPSRYPSRYPQGQGQGHKAPAPAPRKGRQASFTAAGTQRKPDTSERGTRLPADFAVTPAMREWAKTNAPRVDVDYETAQFVDYWTARTGQIAVKRDWVRTWHAWLRKAERDGAGRVKLPRTEQQRFVDWGQ